MRGIKLTAKKGHVVAAFMVALDDEIFVINSGGTVIRMEVREITSQGRGGQGVRAIKLTARKGHVVAAFMVGLDDEIFVINSVGTLIRMEVRGISSQGRDATGVRVMNLEAGQVVAAVAPILATNGDDD